MMIASLIAVAWAGTAEIVTAPSRLLAVRCGHDAPIVVATNHGRVQIPVPDGGCAIELLQPYLLNVDEECPVVEVHGVAYGPTDDGCRRVHRVHGGTVTPGRWWCSYRGCSSLSEAEPPGDRLVVEVQNRAIRGVQLKCPDGRDERRELVDGRVEFAAAAGACELLFRGGPPAKFWPVSRGWYLCELGGVGAGCYSAAAGSPAGGALHVPRLTDCFAEQTPICTGRFSAPLEQVAASRSETRALTYGVAECRVLVDPPEVQVSLTTWGPQEPFRWGCEVAGVEIVYPALDPRVAMAPMYAAGFGKGGLEIHNRTDLTLEWIKLIAGDEGVYRHMTWPRVQPGDSMTWAFHARPDWIMEVTSSLDDGAACTRLPVAVVEGRLASLEITGMTGRYSASEHRCDVE